MIRAEEPDPRLSVVVRSYNRLPILAELLQALLAQDHDSFEVIVVEQSTERAPADVAKIEQLGRDPRVRILRHRPLGGPAARNVGARAARGDILVFIDDDDLPGGPDWLRQHEANYRDPRCLGVTGGSVLEDGSMLRYTNLAKARRLVLSLNLFKWQRCYVFTDQRAKVESIHGGNTSVRRSTLVRFGLWDECTPIEDELSFNYRLAAEKHDHEYVVFDPEAQMIRRLDVPGGMAKRTLASGEYARRIFAFMHNVVGYYFPIRFALLYPLFFIYAGYRVTDWIVSCSRRHGTWTQRALGLAGLYLTLPVLWLGWLGAMVYGRLRHGEPAHRPLLQPRDRVRDELVAPAVVAMRGRAPAVSSTGAARYSGS